MAHFAELDPQNVVTRVIVVADADCIDADGNENESVGAGFLAKLLGGRWVQTSYNSGIRKNYAGVGYRYDPGFDAFVPPQPYPSWTLETDSCQWIAPVAAPLDGGPWAWDEANLNWVAA